MVTSSVGRKSVSENVSLANAPDENPLAPPENQYHSLGILNAFMPTLGSLQQLIGHMPRWRHEGFNAIYLSPVYMTTHSDVIFRNEGAETDTICNAGSPFAMTQGLINPKYTDNKQLNYAQSHKAMQQVADAARDNNLLLMQDAVLNHIGHDSPIFDPTKWKSLLKDPIFGKLAAVALRGEIDPNQMFAPSHEKRHAEVSGNWRDVREPYMRNDEEVENYFTYFAEPYLETLFTYGSGLRIDAPDQLLRSEEDNAVWVRMAETMERICLEKQGVKPTLLFETLGQSPSTYARVLNSFPEEMESNLHYCSGEMWAYTGDNKPHPYHLFNEVSNDNYHERYKAHFAYSDEMKRRGVSVFSTHDQAHNIKHGTGLSSYMDRHGHYDDGMKIATRKILMADLLLSNPSLMVLHADDCSFEHKQPEFSEVIQKSAPADIEAIRSDDAESYMQQLNQTREILYGDGQRYKWSECTLHAETCHVMFTFYPVEEGKAPVIVLLNPNAEARPPEIRGKDTGAAYKEMADKMFACKNPDKDIPKNTEIILIGKFSDNSWLASTAEQQDIESASLQSYHLAA